MKSEKFFDRFLFFLQTSPIGFGFFAAACFSISFFLFLLYAINTTIPAFLEVIFVMITTVILYFAISYPLKKISRKRLFFLQKEAQNPNTVLIQSSNNREITIKDSYDFFRKRSDHKYGIVDLAWPKIVFHERVLLRNLPIEISFGIVCPSSFTPSEILIAKLFHEGMSLSEYLKKETARNMENISFSLKELLEDFLEGRIPTEMALRYRINLLFSELNHIPHVGIITDLHFGEKWLKLIY